MPKYLKGMLLIIVVVFVVVRCNKKEDKMSNQTISTGELTVIADESLTPIIEEQIAVYENDYDAKINLVSKSETEVMNALLKDSINVAILSRQLTKIEIDAFKKKKINPSVTAFATDAITLIRNKKDTDSLVALNDVLDFLRGKEVSTIRGLVFDNPNSSTARHLNELAGLKSSSQKNIFSFNTNLEAIKYVAENDGMIGVVGLNWIMQPSAETREFTNKVVVLSVKGLNSSNYISPTQNNIAEGKYPLARDLFIVNCQGFSGLGTGFTTFIAGDRGQRIILKSGLLPIRMPGRKVVVRNSINKK